MRTKNHGWNPSACIFENDKYLKCIADTLVSVYSEIKNAKNNISANVKYYTNKYDKYYIKKCHEQYVKKFRW